MTTTDLGTFKDQLLEKYSERELKLFIQYDGHVRHTGLQPDRDGQEVFCIATAELMTGSDVRVIVPAGSDPSTTVQLLRKITDWIDRSGPLEHPGLDAAFPPYVTFVARVDDDDEDV